MPVIGHVADLLLSHLLWTSLQAAVLVGVVALTVRLVPRLPASARCALWSLVGLQLMVGLAWQAPVELPWLAPAQSFAAHAQILPSTLVSPTVDFSAPPPSSVLDWRNRLSWRDGLAALWLLGVLAQLPAVMRERRRVRGWLRGAGADVEGSLQRRCASLAKRMGLRRCPQLRVASGVASPLVTGMLRPVILWPARATFSDEEASLALAHELAHLSRGDLWLGCIPALAQRLFFFHPLVRLAMREYALQREIACDERAMGVLGADARSYGQLLVRLGVCDPGPATLAGASATFRSLKRRLRMLEHTGTGPPRGLGWALIALVAILGVAPYRVVAAGGPLAVHPGTDAVGAGAVAAPVATRVSPGSRGGIDAARDGAASTDAACVPSVRADDIPFCGAHSLVYTGPARTGGGIVLFGKSGVFIAGDQSDVVAAKRFYRPGVNLMWFWRDGKAYLVHDPAILQRAGVSVDSVLARIRTQSGLLANDLGKLEAEQDKLSAQQGEISARQAALINEEGRLIAVQSATSDPARSRQLAERMHAQQAKVAALQPEVAALQKQIDALQPRIRARRADLQAWQHAQSDGMRSLANGLSKLADDALATGKAQPVKR